MSGSLRRYTKHHDVIGLWHVPNIKMRHPAVGAKPWYVRINSDGLRDDRDFPKEKPKDKVRITLLGDSFTFGHSVEVHERYSAKLEKHFGDIEILNFGLCSAGLDQHCLVYENIAQQWESDILMVNPYLNNVGRCQLTYHMFQGQQGQRKMSAKPYFELQGDELVLRNVPVLRELSTADQDRLSQAQSQRSVGRNVEADPQRRAVRYAKQLVLERQLKYLAIKAFPIQPYPEYRSSDAPEWRLARAILQRLRAASKQKAMVIAPMPAWSSILNPSLATYRERYAEVHDPANGIHVLDILPYFLELGFADRVRCMVSTRDAHYSDFGNSVAARGVAAELEKTGLLDAVRSGA
ncbi:MAG: hypothetical protein AAF799_31195 [Myxococcota bacterium]